MIRSAGGHGKRSDLEDHARAHRHHREVGKQGLGTRAAKRIADASHEQDASEQHHTQPACEQLDPVPCCAYCANTSAAGVPWDAGMLPKLNPMMPTHSRK